MDTQENAGFKREGDLAFPTEEIENDNSTDSQSEQTDINKTQSQEGDNTQAEENKSDGNKQNLDDHPRWKEREEDWKNRFNDQEKRHLEEIEELRQEFLSKKQEEKSDIPIWFGGNEQQWEAYQEHLNSLTNKAKEEAIQELKNKSNEEQKRIEEATNYFQEQVREIESDSSINPESQKVDQNKLMKFVMDNNLVDTQGRWNYKAGFQMMRLQQLANQTNKVTEKKKIANATTSTNQGEEKKSDYMTSEDFRNPSARPW